MNDFVQHKERRLHKTKVNEHHDAFCKLHHCRDKRYSKNLYKSRPEADASFNNLEDGTLDLWLLVQMDVLNEQSARNG